MAYDTRPTSHRRRTERREQATARNTARQNRTDAAQLAALEARGAGNCAEARCLRVIVELG